MRSKVLSSRIELLSRVSVIAIMGGLIAGCSSGFQRFDTSLYETAIPQQTSNPYPGDLDNRTTASVGGRLAPMADVAPRATPQGVYHQPEPTYAAPPQASVYQPQPYEPYTPNQYAPQNQVNAAPARQPLSGYKPLSGKSISGTELAKPQYVAPKPDVNQQTVYIPEPKTDPVKTAAIAPAVPAPSQSRDGWTSAGGTNILIREGETLYNLSKRYGVPVSAIRSANNMTAADSLKAGQRVLIPNYVFSPTASVSAPDNNPNTRAARASTGYVGEAKNSRVGVPAQRPVKVAALPTSDSKTTVNESVVAEARSASVYTVKSGDSLSKIASLNGVTVAALQQANGLSGANIRIGQSLNIPGKNMGDKVDSVTTASIKPADKLANVDPIVTGSLKQPKSKIDLNSKAPERSGISNFRWPVKGRVVSQFGADGTNGPNEGIDISVPEGTAVHAAENGVVIYAGDEISSYGKLILVRHTDDWVSAYAHNRDFEVKKGDQVRRGQIIARSGRTGKADRPKLHFELRKDSTPVDPKKHLAG